MNKVSNSVLNEAYYHSKLPNGIDLFVIEKPEYKTSVCCFGTPYGALNLRQQYGDDKHCFHSGLAHFLEHKLFESDECDVMKKFSDLGADVNAFTSFTETVYYFSTITDNLSPCLNLLLDFVQDLNINYETVEKEKGIIKQEVLMYRNMPISRLFREVFASLYSKYPLKYDIGGSLEDIEKISVDELYTAYNLNYHPSNMKLIVVSPYSHKDILTMVLTNQSRKQFSESIKLNTIFDDEPKEVARKEYVLAMSVNETKNAYAVKLGPNAYDIKGLFKKEWSIRILLEMIFSPINPEYQQWLDQEIINDFFGYEIEIDKDHGELIFYCEKHDPKYLKEFIDNKLKGYQINLENFEILKRRYLSLFFNNLNDIEEYAIDFARGILNNHVLFDEIEIIKSITIEDLKKYFSELSFENYSLVSIINDKEC